MLHVHSQVPGLGHREPGSGILVQVRVRVPNLAPEPDNPYPKPGARDLRPEDAFHVCTFAQAVGRFALLHLGRLGEPSLPPRIPCQLVN